MSTTSSSSSSSWPRIPYTPPSSPDTTSFPYSTKDLTPMDPSSDEIFYFQPRFVTHIDDSAISTLGTYFSEVLPTASGSKILDLCTSWISHYPPPIESAVEEGTIEVIGIGMNDSEMKANPVLQGRYVVKDLNLDPTISGWPEDRLQGTGEYFDCTTCTVSIDYLTKPLEVLSSLRDRTKKGGSVHLIISNRCFPTKAVRKWLEIGEEDRLRMVADYLAWSGWNEIEILELRKGGWMSGDPLWVVKGCKA
ncbi:uncharacterized protein I303_102308 [Kwoniella dejecticola CBS 10117]|uniref:Methyltransferase type 11 domain-containing protein n=1 Tax=Kwoniella dejecticola CBS 10117 TaxID=1296121 RepID=A0A1A6ABB1_9TREE|nr:uncharacterized protein I303_01552 [Kwoniella dejecticola CBS 10117]OBR87350.1 hypothetical protein I303_01552 [Kwoniella dejecticola CBS 10117]